MAIRGVTMDVSSDGVAVIKFFNPPVNALSPPILAGLKRKLDKAIERVDVKAMVLMGEGGKFCGGFDINVFQSIQRKGNSAAPEVSGGLVVKTIEEAKKPTVAAIDGLALGGGLELAMGCHARVSTPKSQLGLVELALGIIPGMGGTQRLPRLVGISKAIEMMLLSQTIMSEEGEKLGLIDVVASSNNVLKLAQSWALDIAERRRPWLSSLCRTDRLGPLSEAREVVKVARLQARQNAANMPQHQACLDAVEEGIVHGGYSGILKEAEVSNVLVSSSTAKALMHVFFAQRAASKVPNVTDIGLRPRHVEKVAIIGGGIMGSGIATALILSGISVVLKEIDVEYLKKGMKVVEANLQGLAAKGNITKEKAERAFSILKGVLDYSEFRHVDMVIEAATENVLLKQSIFGEIEKVCTPHCILATNTSTINLNIVGRETNSQDRIIGAHFFSPAHVMPLLEIIRTERTSAQVILDLMTLGKMIKKVPIVVGNCTGFAVNRTFFPYGQGSHFLVNLGVDLFRIDKVIRDFGLKIGPFQLQDLAGPGLRKEAGKEYANAFPDRIFSSPLAELMVINGRYGKSNGKGYYIYEKGNKPKPDYSIQSLIEESRRLSNIMPSGKPITVNDQDIVEMIFFPVVNEACRVMDEGIVVRASDLDIASTLGMNFPSYRGGIVFWADTFGSGYIYTKLKKLSEAYGGFFKPCKFLEERASRGMTLSAPASRSEVSRSNL
ncbi:hypothetical protein Syun_025999 [Stephania yunnanensis]|uniref:3-hydroxyacyl-CoA dehydrogenase n=1 Tax=Stephania yunnanensis TaxID=152371 RepID=A0AAP0HVU6_9MAGN